jgi:heptosyltransferase-2
VIHPKKILIIRFSSIGDIVLTTPVIRILSQQLGASIHYLTKKVFKDILLSNPYVDKTYTIDLNVAEVLEDLREEQYDFVVDLHNNLRSMQVKMHLRKPGSSFRKLNIQKWMLVNMRINTLPNEHIVERYLETVARFGIKNDNKGLDFFISDDASVNLQMITSDLITGEFICIVIGAGLPTKSMQEHQIIQLVNMLDFPVVLIGGPEDREAGERIAAKTRAINQAGLLSIPGSASILSACGLVISHDTGMMHIAAALKKPVISIWGNTIPEFGMYPYYGERVVKHKIFEIHDLSCRPCSKIGFQKCPKGHFRCILDLDITKIALTANQWIRMNTKPA